MIVVQLSMGAVLDAGYKRSLATAASLHQLPWAGTIAGAVLRQLDRPAAGNLRPALGVVHQARQADQA